MRDGNEKGVAAGAQVFSVRNSYAYSQNAHSSLCSGIDEPFMRTQSGGAVPDPAGVNERPERGGEQSVRVNAFVSFPAGNNKIAAQRRTAFHAVSNPNVAAHP